MRNKICNSLHANLHRGCCKMLISCCSGVQTRYNTRSDKTVTSFDRLIMFHPLLIASLHAHAIHLSKHGSLLPITCMFHFMFTIAFFTIVSNLPRFLHDSKSRWLYFCVNLEDLPVNANTMYILYIRPVYKKSKPRSLNLIYVACLTRHISVISISLIGPQKWTQDIFHTVLEPFFAWNKTSCPSILRYLNSNPPSKW